jgi:tight adherence protein C
MLQPETMFAVSAAGAVGAAGYWVSRLLVGGDEARIRDRLVGTHRDEPARLRDRVQVTSLVKRLSQAAAEPFMPRSGEKLTGMRQRLAQAGVYSPQAIKIVTGLKLILLVGGCLLGYAVGVLAGYALLGFAFGGIVGYLAPQMWLRGRIVGNQRMLTLGLPDALDLMVVCVEAGLTVDAAVQRVGEEIAVAHPALSRELGLYHLQTQIGVSRQDALRNLAHRTANPGLQAVAAVLIQAERFGTSIAQSLRVQAESLRVARQLAAEEMASKASVKLSFPLVLLIFPATFIVLVGPAMLTMFASPLFE